MSMINDALRRASHAAKAAPEGAGIPPMAAAPPPPSAGTELPPPVPPSAFPPPPLPMDGPGELPPLPPMRIEPARKKSSLPLFLILFLVFCAAGAGGFYVWKKIPLPITAREKGQPADEDPTENETIAALLGDENARAKISDAIDRAESQPAPRPAVPARTPPQPPRTAEPTAARPVPAVVVPQAPQVPVKFPPLRLQSIFYRPSNPSVMINGKTLFIGDEIHGVTVANIQASSVTLVLSGQTNFLTLR